MSISINTSNKQVVTSELGYVRNGTASRLASGGRPSTGSGAEASTSINDRAQAASRMSAAESRAANERISRAQDSTGTATAGASSSIEGAGNIEEVAGTARRQIMSTAAASMLAQANKLQPNVMALLQ